MSYTWKALYKDGASLEQIERTGKKNTYADIDRKKLSGFELWNGSNRVFYLKIDRGQRLIWRRRTEMGQGGQVLGVCHIVGKQETVEGKNIQGIALIFESDGRIEMADRFDENHPWLYPIMVNKDDGEDWLI